MSTTRRGGTLTSVLTAYLSARGEQADQTWAEDVAAVLVLDGASPGVIRDELERALPLVAESGEGPEELYGPAREWARGRVADRAERGGVVVDSSPDSTWRDVPVIGGVTAALVTVMVAVVWLVSEGLTTDYTWGLILLPLLGGLTVIGALTTHERMLTRATRPVAVLAALAVVVVGIALTVWLLLGTRDQVLVSASTFWLGALAIGYAVLATLIDRLLPKARPRPAEGRDWEAELAGTLRLRMDLDEARVQEIVREARDHAARSGQSLGEEFGTPASYASRFPQDRLARARRAAWLQTALVPLMAFVAFSGLLDEPGWAGVSWTGVLLLALSIWLAVGAWRKVRAEG